MFEFCMFDANLPLVACWRAPTVPCKIHDAWNHDCIIHKLTTVVNHHDVIPIPTIIYDDIVSVNHAYACSYSDFNDFYSSLPLERTCVDSYVS